MQKKFISVCMLALLLPCAGNAEATDEHRAARQAVQQFGAGCAIAQTTDADGEPVYLWQHAFEDGAHDLAMARTQQGSLLEIRRITFGGSTQQGCHYPQLAIARGGDWGWHLAWTLAQVPPGKPALRYARMDGAAWVSSPAKRFGDAGAHDPALIVEGEKLTLRWLEAADAERKTRTAVSDDAGRNWR